MRARHPGLDYCFPYSDTEPPRAKPDRPWRELFDVFEAHIWMVQANDHEFLRRLGKRDGRFDPRAYQDLVDRGEVLYRADPEYWQGMLQESIERYADWSRQHQLALMTTECWGVIGYKDWPLLDWAWVKELCAFGTRAAAATGRWAAIATSNFCGPQFVGMWRDIDWHRRLTDVIHEAELPPEARG